MTKLYKDPSDIRYLTIIDLFCQFSEKLELVANESGLKFLTRRLDFLREEVGELEEATLADNKIEMVDGAADVAFVAITQIYHVFRYHGLNHNQAVVKTVTALTEVGKTNLMKNIPEKEGDKITKPEDWQPPKLEECFLTPEELLKRHKAERKNG